MFYYTLPQVKTACRVDDTPHRRARTRARAPAPTRCIEFGYQLSEMIMYLKRDNLRTTQGLGEKQGLIYYGCANVLLDNYGTCGIRFTRLRVLICHVHLTPYHLNGCFFASLDAKKVFRIRMQNKKDIKDMVSPKTWYFKGFFVSSIMERIHKNIILLYTNI